MVKKLVFLFISVVLIAILCQVGCKSEETSNLSPRYPIDNAIKASIQTSYSSDFKLRELSLSVSVENGIVTISGEVDNTDTLNKALSIAENVDGVSEVVNKITVSRITYP
ncbi:MAG: BON domain-containing protein [Actinomycetia bacterium]|nr:BON domain-containing protein [Actinomycetes bacterium]